MWVLCDIVSDVIVRGGDVNDGCGGAFLSVCVCEWGVLCMVIMGVL
jgi:hypothetical protein